MFPHAIPTGLSRRLSATPARHHRQTTTSSSLDRRRRCPRPPPRRRGMVGITTTNSTDVSTGVSTDPKRQSNPPWSQPLRAGLLAAQLLAARVGTSAAEQRALAAGDDAVARTRRGLGYESGQASVADLGAAHGVGCWAFGVVMVVVWLRAENWVAANLLEG